MHLHFWTARFFLRGGGCRYSPGAAVGGISTFGRVDYDLSTDIKGFDRHFVESRPEQRHWGNNAAADRNMSCEGSKCG